MRSVLHIKAIAIAVILLFLSGQAMAQTHAIEFGGTDHSHEGVACSVALVSVEHAVIEPAVTLAVPLETDSTDTVAPFKASPMMRGYSSRAPPPRGPPSIQ